MKRVLFLILTGIILVNAKEISLRKFLNDYSQRHKNIEFFVLGENNVKNFIDNQEEANYLKYNLNTLKYFLEIKLKKGVNFKQINFNGKKVLFLELGNKIKTSPFETVIKQLEYLKNYGGRLEIVNPSFDYKNYKRDLDIIIQKLKEYQRLSR